MTDSDLGSLSARVPLRVTHLASGDLWAGAESQLFNLVVASRKNASTQVDVVLLNEGLLAERLRAEAVPVTVLDERRLGTLALLRALHAHVTRRRTQVLHTHRYKENVLGSLVSLARRGLRTTRTLHGAPESEPGRFDVRRRLQRRLDWLCARVVQWPVVCVSHPLAAICRETLPASRLRVVENGIDVEGLSRRSLADIALPADSFRFRVGFFGRLSPVKRVDLVIEIARCLDDRDPGAYGVFVFGEGPLRPELERLARERGVDHCVRFMGFADEPAAYLRAMDALLLTSDHEGLPMVVLEAMALRVPVVSHAVGAIPELLDGGRVGSLIDGQTPREYADAVATLHGSPAERARQAEQAYERVLARYSVARMSSEYAALYAELTARP